MKKCNACGGEFENAFGFCPVDGMLLTARPDFDRKQLFQLTLIDEAHLPRRLANELTLLVLRARKAWPGFRRHPLTFTKSKLSELGHSLNEAVRRPYVLPGMMTAFVAVLALILGVGLLESRISKTDQVSDSYDPSEVTTIDFSSGPKPESDSGIGSGKKGRVGFEEGRGEGSKPTPARARGGGGGGDHTLVTQSRGRLPLPSVIPAPIPTAYVRLPQALPEAGIDLDPALWRNLNFAAYGDPRSKSTVPSNGPGDGGGVGSGNRTGIGEGDGPGFGPGRNGNMGGGEKGLGCCGPGGSPGNNPDDDPDHVYSSPEVTSRVRLLAKPEPQYTEEARKTNITGTVILRVVFSRTGEVTNIRVIKTLSGGLTEKAIAAARQIRFVPATRNGRPVSVAMQLEYNFNLY
jgi:TonB family protein